MYWYHTPYGTPNSFISKHSVTPAHISHIAGIHTCSCSLDWWKWILVLLLDLENVQGCFHSNCLQYANTLGESLGDLVTCGVFGSTHGECCFTKDLKPLPLYCPPKSWRPECSQGRIMQFYCSKHQGWVNAKQLGSGIGPQFAYPWLHDVTTCDKLKSPRPSPFIFAHCNPSLTGGGNSLGTKLDKTQMLFYIYDVDVLVKLHTTSMRPANVHVHAACVCTWPWTAYCTQLYHNVHTLHHNNLHYNV